MHDPLKHSVLTFHWWLLGVSAFREDILQPTGMDAAREVKTNPTEILRPPLWETSVRVLSLHFAGPRKRVLTRR
jgi:hypothetical protein